MNLFSIYVDQVEVANNRLDILQDGFHRAVQIIYHLVFQPSVSCMSFCAVADDLSDSQRHNISRGHMHIS
jgi:predicted dithiol-disulfide oxidoreductase (DUF899 family)